MKYMKQIAFILALLLLLTGCNSNPVGTTEAPFVPPNSVPMMGDDIQSTEPEISDTVQYLPEEVENPDGLPVLRWLCLGSGNKSDAAMAEINRVLAEKNMPFRLQFILYRVEELPEAWFSLKETVALAEEADLITGAITAEEAVQYLAPITENAKGTAEPSLANAFIHDSYLSKTTINGTVYGIPAITAELEVIGWRVKSSVLKDGVTTNDFTRSIWEMDDVFASIYANNNNTPFLYPLSELIVSSGSARIPISIYTTSYAEFEFLAACYAIDYTLDTPAVVNVLDTERIRLTQAAMKRYTEAGYVTTEDTRKSAMVNFTRLHADFPYAIDDQQYIPIGATQAAGNAPSGYMTGISAASENKDAALSLLALMADDLEFRKLLFFGREGQEYQLENGVLRTLPDENGNVYSMLGLSSLVDFCGAKLNYHQEYFPTQDGEDLNESFPAMLERSVIRYPLSGVYGFDTSAIEAEIAAVNKILEGVEEEEDEEEEDNDKPKDGIDFVSLTPEKYDELLQKIKDAGGDKIQAELQRQLDEWLAENPDWNK